MSMKRSRIFPGLGAFAGRESFFDDEQPAALDGRVAAAAQNRDAVLVVPVVVTINSGPSNALPNPSTNRSQAVRVVMPAGSLPASASLRRIDSAEAATTSVIAAPAIAAGSRAPADEVAPP